MGTQLLSHAHNNPIILQLSGVMRALEWLSVPAAILLCYVAGFTVRVPPATQPETKTVVQSFIFQMTSLIVIT